MFNVNLERREGLFGLVRKSEPLGQIYPHQCLSHNLRGSRVVLSLGPSETTLLIRASGQSISVEFPAEPQKLKPTVTVTLDQDHPEIILSCEMMTISSDADRSQRLIVTAPKFLPRFMPLQKAEIRARLFSTA